MSDGSDLDWLGLERTAPGEWGFEVTPGLSRLDGKFYGGTGIAVATAVMEAETGRRALWTSVQFVASGTTGDRMRAEVEVRASGRRTSQVQVAGWCGDRLVFSAIGATGTAQSGPVTASFGSMPDVPAPESCERWLPLAFMDSPEGPLGWLAISDVRTVAETGAMWMRLKGRPLSRPAMCFLADVVPNGVLRAAGRIGAGTSLDNTVRFGPDPEGEWMLVEVEPHMVNGGYVHGAARLWSQGGTLLGVASQTAGVVLFDEPGRR
ncbi:MAG TPA: thioesterase family protein [Acidimicrobiales bacterium]|nr:thioesterase family protein [Acidimicrobiales bacterium]